MLARSPQCLAVVLLRELGDGTKGDVANRLSLSVTAELEFAQIVIIVVVVTVMVVVIVCLLNHYKVSTRSFINRPNQSRRQEDGLQPVSVGLSLSVLPRPLSRAPKVRLGASKGHKAGQPLESAHCGP